MFPTSVRKCCSCPKFSQKSKSNLGAKPVNFSEIYDECGKRLLAKSAFTRNKIEQLAAIAVEACNPS